MLGELETADSSSGMFFLFFLGRLLLIIFVPYRDCVTTLIFLMLIIKRYFLYMRLCFYTFWFLSWWTIKLKVLACSFEITYQFRKSFKEPASKILKRQFWHWSCIQEVACDKLILPHVISIQWEVGTTEHRAITEKGMLRRDSVSIFKNSK